MNWGDVPAWGALVVAVVAAVFSGLALKHSRQSAEAAEQSAIASDRSAAAAERSAAADEAALTEMRREAQERRNAEAEATRPKPDLRVTRTGGVQYVLRNVGTGAAINVTVVRAGKPGQCRSLPDGATLQPGEGHEFQILTAMGMPVPTTIYVTWDGQDDPVALEVPL
ncbi:hypothetical protein [Streptomyces glomeratus]|nr:hypothetical protein [Streptomyces glomeratus]MCF1510117.1 hypothetical protein [Streptomyces glomeratus]